MKKYYITSFIFVLIGVGIYFFYPNEQYYKTLIYKEREEKNTFMRSSDNSPLKGKDLKKLHYYPVDISYRVLSKVHFFKKKKFHRSYE